MLEIQITEYRCYAGVIAVLEWITDDARMVAWIRMNLKYMYNYV